MRIRQSITCPHCDHCQVHWITLESSHDRTFICCETEDGGCGEEFVFKYCVYLQGQMGKVTYLGPVDV